MKDNVSLRLLKSEGVRHSAIAPVSLYRLKGAKSNTQEKTLNSEGALSTVLLDHHNCFPKALKCEGSCTKKSVVARNAPKLVLADFAIPCSASVAILGERGRVRCRAASTPY